MQGLSIRMIQCFKGRHIYLFCKENRPGVKKNEPIGNWYEIDDQ